jgi:von Willebrand factor type A domain
MHSFAHRWEVQAARKQPLLDGDAAAFVISFFAHLALIIALGFAPIAAPAEEVVLVVSSAPAEEQVDLKLPDEFSFSDLPSVEIGSHSVQGVAAALSMAPVISEVAAVPSHLLTTPVELGRLEINDVLETATGRHYAENLAVKGAAGEGTTGAVGAIDRITHEILLSLEERKTLVVWLFDETESLVPQRKAIRDRFSRIYDELGIIEASGNDTFVKHESKPLLSSVVGFGSSFKYITDKPTDSLTELRQAVTSVPNDESGTENVFSAIYDVAKHYANYRYTTSEKPTPERNVMIVVFTDEAGSDTDRAEEAIKMCRRWAIPVYVIGVPAPFGRKETRLKWIDPDPKYDQTAQWGVVEQGPESYLPERIRLSFAGSTTDEEPMDSGFGPYALTRLCVETGGIYFAVHPNRNVTRRVTRGETAAYSAYLTNFFDPEIMRRYRPDYVSVNEYQKRLTQNKTRSALIQAAASSAQLSDAVLNDDPKQQSELDRVGAIALDNRPSAFIKRDEAAFARELSEAQQAAALLEPKINSLYQILQHGEADRDKETVMRWRAGYDLAMGRVLAAKVRTETYNAMLATAKRGLKLKDPKNNTFELKPNEEISVGSNYVKLAERAKMYLTRVVTEHAGTPWALLARRELDQPLGWKWDDRFTDLTPKPAPKLVANNNNNVVRPKTRPEPQTPAPAPPPKRPVPKKL